MVILGIMVVISLLYAFLLRLKRELIRKAIA